MAQRQSTERERTLAGALSNRHPDTIRRFVKGLNVTATTREAIESACQQLGYEHFVAERLRALAAKEGQP